jgi:DNA polymerase-3 subunit alpha
MIIFDTETTGLIASGLKPLSEQPEIIEFAAIKLDDHSLEEVGRFEFMCRPSILPLPRKITEITGIETEDLFDKKPFSFYFPELAEFFFAERYSFAHNHAFDTGMLSLELRRLKAHYKFPWTMRPICTVAATYGIKNYRLNLQKLYQHLFGESFPEAHRAMNDVQALTKIVKELIKLGVVKL